MGVRRVTYTLRFHQHARVDWEGPRGCSCAENFRHLGMLRAEEIVLPRESTPGGGPIPDSQHESTQGTVCRQQITFRNMCMCMYACNNEKRVPGFEKEQGGLPRSVQREERGSRNGAIIESQKGTKKISGNLGATSLQSAGVWTVQSPCLGWTTSIS